MINSSKQLHLIGYFYMIYPILLGFNILIIFDNCKLSCSSSCSFIHPICVSCFLVPNTLLIIWVSEHPNSCFFFKTRKWMIPSENHILPKCLIWQPAFFKSYLIFLSFILSNSATQRAHRVTFQNSINFARQTIAYIWHIAPTFSILYFISSSNNQHHYGFRSSRMWRWVIGRVFPDVSK
jgi:hypothetical protein